jgi:hypothetical protein
MSVAGQTRPLRWGKYIMLFVYDAIDGDIGKELRKKNPQPRFLRNHHQWLKKFGRDKVHDQIERVITIMKLCNNMDDFREKFARVFNKSPIQLSLCLISIWLNERGRQLRRPWRADHDYPGYLLRRRWGGYRLVRVASNCDREDTCWYSR